jgi:hypothetical protein
MVLATLLLSPVFSQVYALETLFMVNEPEQMSFIDMNEIGKYIDGYNKKSGVITQKETDLFFDVVRRNGAPEAGYTDATIGLVMQGINQCGNNTNEPRGVLVVTGRFDKEKILEELKKNYIEVAEKNNNTPYFATSFNEDINLEMHTFMLPPSNRRELAIVSIGNHTFFSSGAANDYSLLQKTIDVVKGNKFVDRENLTSSVELNLTLTETDRNRLVETVNENYALYKEKKSKEKANFFKKFILGKIGDSKVEGLNESLKDLSQYNLLITRGKSSDGVNTKTIRSSMVYDTDEMAQDVKKNLLSDFTRVIKKTNNLKEKFSMSNNFRIRREGKEVIIDTSITNQEEQLKAMAIISTYVVASLVPSK